MELFLYLLCDAHFHLSCPLPDLNLSSNVGKPLVDVCGAFAWRPRNTVLGERKWATNLEDVLLLKDDHDLLMDYLRIKIHYPVKQGELQGN